MKKTTNQHGGPRPNSGRPRVDTVALLVRPKRRTAEAMRALAKAQDLTLGQLLDQAFPADPHPAKGK